MSFSTDNISVANTNLNQASNLTGEKQDKEDDKQNKDLTKQTSIKNYEQEKDQNLYLRSLQKFDTLTGKPLVIYKSMINLSINASEVGIDFNELSQKIFSEIKMDGLYWNRQYKIVDIAYGLQKLQINCVIEDMKVSVDDIIEQIQDWDTIMSVNIDMYSKI